MLKLPDPSERDGVLSTAADLGEPARGRRFSTVGPRTPASPALIAAGVGLAVAEVVGVLAGVGPARRSLAFGPDRALRG